MKAQRDIPVQSNTDPSKEEEWEGVCCDWFAIFSLS